MSSTNSFLTRNETLAWLAQFRPDEQSLVSDMLRKMLLVSRDEFSERLLTLVRQRFAQGLGPVGLYAERELRKRKGVPHLLFKETRTKVKRAFGSGPQPVQPIRAYDLDVGSEGIVAQLVSELCREEPKNFISHPGPDQIRKSKVRRFILVTDFIGSGNRACTYLEAAWRVKSVRSWWSSRPSNGMSLEVVAYSGTETGVARVEAHPSEPVVTLVAPCPTIYNSFGRSKASELVAVCVNHFPGRESKPSLGYGETGALIAFAHGAPNNCPRIFYERTGTWEPLFPKRVTSALRSSFSEQKAAERLRERLLDMRQRRLASSSDVVALDPRKQNLVAVLASLSHPPRTGAKVALRTGLTLNEVEKFLAKALGSGWIDGANRLTDQGHAELESLRKASEQKQLPEAEVSHYCPAQLRAPQVFRR